MEIPRSIATIWNYEEVAQRALKDVVCRRVAAIVGVFAVSSDAKRPCLIVDVIMWTVVQDHIVLSFFICERIFGFDLCLLSHPSVCRITNVALSLLITCE